jgi:hypothetical protein
MKRTREEEKEDDSVVIVDKRSLTTACLLLNLPNEMLTAIADFLVPGQRFLLSRTCTQLYTLFPNKPKEQFNCPRERPWIKFAFGPDGSESLIDYFWHYMRAELISTCATKLIKYNRLRGLQHLYSRAYRRGSPGLDYEIWYAQRCKNEAIVEWLEKVHCDGTFDNYPDD